MGKGLAFLMVKPWHPLTRRNQERKYIEEQKDKDRQKRDNERADELKRESEFWVNKTGALNNTAEARKLALQAPVAFLYQPPPTLYVMVQLV
jgi:hypothetical protein